MVDALSSGGSVRKDVLVRIQSRAHNRIKNAVFLCSENATIKRLQRFAFLFICFNVTGIFILMGEIERDSCLNIIKDLLIQPTFKFGNFVFTDNNILR